jgi:cytochrome c oxidase subunit 2
VKAAHRHALVVALLWVALTIIGEILLIRYNPFPVAAAEEAEVIDHAFRVLMHMAVPVFAFVVVVLLYVALRFRARGGVAGDGPPIYTHGAGVAAWFLATSALTIAITVYPGITDLLELRRREAQPPEVLVRVEGMRWAWQVTYPQYGVTTLEEMVLPVGKRVRFEVTSRDTDVLHAFWVPAFRVKIDAVPGLVTYTTAVPTKVGSFHENSAFRIQCAEMCGVRHAYMVMPVRVVPEEEFKAWLALQRQRR